MVWSKFGVVGMCILALGTGVMAQDKASVLARMKEAYGGDRLAMARTLTVIDRYKLISSEGGRRPGQANVSRLHSRLAIDFENGRRAVKNWTDGVTGTRLGQIMFNGQDGWSINFHRGSHVVRHDLNGQNVGAGMMRLLDTTLVHGALTQPESVTYLGEAIREEQLKDKITTTLNGAEQTLYVDRESGLVTEATRGDSVLFVYGDHRHADGVAYAGDTDLFVDGQPSMVLLRRELVLNQDVDDAFVIPEGFTELDGMMDTSEMVVDALGDNTYLVGKGFSATLFVDAGDYIVAAGAIGGVKPRLEALYGALGTEKPLKYVVVPEHRPGHAGGIKEFADLGASFIVASGHKAVIQKRLSADLPEERFISVEGSEIFARGKIQVFEISMLTDEQFLVTYVPEAKLAFVVDEFGTNLRTALPSANRNTGSFLKALEGLDIDVKQIAHVHGTRVLTMDNLRKVAAGYHVKGCPSHHDVCGD